jgi:integral membrane protein (TIGR00529 family)
LVLLLDTVLIALLFAHPVEATVDSVFQGLTAPQTLNLAGAVFLVLVLAELLRRTRSVDRMVTSLQAVVPDSRVVLALIPSMIGLMPMLGGAMFSAPMVDGVGRRLDLSPSRKTFINYWFRHAMEYVFPLYSSLLIVSALIEVTPYAFIGVAYPLTFAAIAGGIVWGLWGVSNHRRQAGEATDVAGQDTGRGEAWRGLLTSTWPLLLVIVLVVVLKANMLLSLVGVILLTVLAMRIGPTQWLDVLRRSLPLRTFIAIFAVMVFKQVIEDAGAVEAVPNALSGLGLPPLLVAFLVPHVIGLLTGTPPAAMALSVPLVMPLVGSTAIDPIAGGVWMFAGAFTGVLLSPLHLCLSLTREYYGANWGQLYRVILPATALIVATALGIVLWRPVA